MKDNIVKVMELDMEIIVNYAGEYSTYCKEGKILGYDEITGNIEFQPKILTINKNKITSFEIKSEALK